MAYESIKVDIIPGAENAEVLHFSQYDNKRPFFIELFNGADEFIPEAGMTITLECRKRDGNIVIISDPVMNDNVAEFSTTEQLTACYGDNMAEIKIVDENDLVIGSANFIINVEKSPTCGGLVSESEIDNLTQQIEDITQQVIGNDYYNKAQTDALLHEKVDASVLNANYYTKWATDSMLANKADKSELPDMNNYYNKTEADALLADKLNDYQLDDTPVLGSVSAAQIVSGWDSQHGSYKLIKNVALNTYSKSEIDTIIDNIFPTFTASGVIASFITALNKPLVSVTAEAGATTITRCGVNLFDDAYVDNNLTAEQTLPAGTYYIKAFVTGSSEQNRRFSIYFNDTWNVIDTAGTFDDGGITWSGSTFGWLYTDATATVTLTKPYKLRASVLVDTYQTRRYAIYDDNSITQFIEYNGQTVPVADATTLATLSGLNNVFANSGDVTVQYKYMSI